MWALDSAGRRQEKNPGIQDQVPEETSPQRAQDQRLCGACGSSRASPGNHHATEVGMVWPCREAWHPLQNHRASTPSTEDAGAGDDERACPTTSRTRQRWPSHTCRRSPTEQLGGGRLTSASVLRPPPPWQLQKSRDWMNNLSKRRILCFDSLWCRWKRLLMWAVLPL